MHASTVYVKYVGYYTDWLSGSRLCPKHPTRQYDSLIHSPSVFFQVMAGAYFEWYYVFIHLDFPTGAVLKVFGERLVVLCSEQGWLKASRAVKMVVSNYALCFLCHVWWQSRLAHRYTSRRVRVPHDVGLYSPVGARGISSVGWPSTSSPPPGEL